MRVFSKEEFWAEALRCNPHADRRQFESAWRTAWTIAQAFGLAERMSTETL